MPRAPEWRQDPLTGRLVLISPERAERPLKTGSHCPFCEGHEAETPPEVLAIRAPDSVTNGPGWRVRVVPNRYAAVRLDAARTGEPTAAAVGGAVSTPAANTAGSPGIGVAEVFIECPQHETKFRNLSREQVSEVLRAWRDRLRLRRDDPRIAYAQVFKNEGRSAGASVAHCHSQFIGINFIPPQITKELDHLQTLWDAAGVCPYCQWMDAGRSSDRYVADSICFAVFCPPAPRFPGEMWLLPKFHADSIDALPGDALGELGDVVVNSLRRMDRAFGDPDFNLIVKSAPYRRLSNYHWRIEILPRTTTTAGWEWGTGLIINTLFPEDAARLLRDAG